MSEKLADWYSYAKIDVSGDLIKSRKESLKNYSKGKECKKHIGDFLNLFFGTGNENNSEFYEYFAGIIKKQDEAFTINKIQEMKILAGDILYETAMSDDFSSLRVMLWAMMMRFLKNGGFIPEISKEICDAFLSYSASLREDACELSDVAGIDKINLKFAKETQEEEPEPEYLFDGDVAQKLDELVDKVNSVVRGYNLMQDRVNDAIRLLHEDTQILWWILGGQSDVTKKRYKDMNAADAAFLSGYDLAKQVVELPGPYSADVMLRHMLKQLEGHDKLLIGEFVDQISGDIVNDFSYRSPLLFAIEKKKENGAGMWHKPLEDVFGLDVEMEVSKEDIAYEIYLECIYQRVMEEE